MKSMDCDNGNADAFTLMDGTVLTGIPIDPPQDPDNPAYRRWPSREAQDAERDLFVQNAHYLLANAPRIFADSRMFLAPVNIQSGVSGGGFVKPCLGGYLEWWLNCPCSTRREGEKLFLTYVVSGSAFSGRNGSRSVAADGTIGGGTAGVWSLGDTFRNTMRRYGDARRRFVADSLADVLATLRGLNSEEGNGENE